MVRNSQYAVCRSHNGAFCYAARENFATTTAATATTTWPTATCNTHSSNINIPSSNNSRKRRPFQALVSGFYQCLVNLQCPLPQHHPLNPLANPLNPLKTPHRTIALAVGN